MSKGKVLKRIFGDPQAKALRRIKTKVKEINDLAPKYQKMSDQDLIAQTDKFKKDLAKKSLDKILPEAFAVVREASNRVLKMRHFDV